MVNLKMIQQISFLVSFFMFFFLSVSGTDSNIYLLCSQLNFDLSTPYELNINSLFTSIVDSASISNFNTFEVSLPGNSQTNIVYGLFQCQGDLNSQCKDCVARSVSQLKTTCPVSVGGTIQLERCFVKYDNVSFLGVDDKTQMWKKCGPSIGCNSDVSNSIDNTLNCLIAGNGQYFREGDFGSIHGVAQCVQDLSVSDCQDCLLETSGRLRSACESSSSGDMYLGKCYISYTSSSNAENNSHNHKTNAIGRDILVQVIGNIAGGAITGFVSYLVSIKVTEARVKLVGIDVKSAKKIAEAATNEAQAAIKEAKEANTTAYEASKKADTANQVSLKALHDVQSHRLPPPYNSYCY